MPEETFRTSSYCTDAHGCVEVAMGEVYIRIRDGKDPDTAQLMFNKDEWAAFVRGVKAGEFDH
jgi:hypothetical protein